MNLANGGHIQLIPAIFGDFIEVEIPLVQLNAERALELAQALICQAHLLQQRELVRENRLLSLSEVFSLTLVGSGENETLTGQPVGETLSRS